jgi:hypothetical protein
MRTAHAAQEYSWYCSGLDEMEKAPADVFLFGVGRILAAMNSTAADLG